MRREGKAESGLVISRSWWLGDERGSEVEELRCHGQYRVDYTGIKDAW